MFKHEHDDGSVSETNSGWNNQINVLHLQTRTTATRTIKETLRVSATKW